MFGAVEMCVGGGVLCGGLRVCGEVVGWLVWGCGRGGVDLPMKGLEN